VVYKNAVTAVTYVDNILTNLVFRQTKFIFVCAICRLQKKRVFLRGMLEWTLLERTTRQKICRENVFAAKVDSSSFDLVLQTTAWPH